MGTKSLLLVTLGQKLTVISQILGKNGTIWGLISALLIISLLFTLITNTCIFMLEM
jgi:hypothetical protein